MRHICSGEDVCMMVRKEDDRIVSINESMDSCATCGGGNTYCGIIGRTVYFELGNTVKKKQERREESAYQLRMMPIFQDETKAEFLRRFRKDAYERKPMMRQW